MPSFLYKLFEMHNTYNGPFPSQMSRLIISIKCVFKFRCCLCLADLKEPEKGPTSGYMKKRQVQILGVKKKKNIK